MPFGIIGRWAKEFGVAGGSIESISDGSWLWSDERCRAGGQKLLEFGVGIDAETTSTICSLLTSSYASGATFGDDQGGELRFQAALESP